ncbi:MAG: type II secretion system F family protein [Acidimicrobiales bacterium]
MNELALLGFVGGSAIAIAGAAFLGEPAGVRYRTAPPNKSGPRYLDAPERLPILVGIGTRLEKLTTTQASREQRQRDFAVTGRTPSAHATATALGAIVGFLVPLAGLAGLRASPLHASGEVALAGALVGAISLGLLPRLMLASAAKTARRRFTRSLSSWLDLVALGQAGGMGIEGALYTASGFSSDPAFLRIRGTLERARHAGVAPWKAMGRLGQEIGVLELEELSASLCLAGTEGAHIRASLSAKASSLRQKQMAAAKAAANSTTERLFLPSVVMMIGFMIFLMYPAGVAFSHVLSG